MRRIPIIATLAALLGLLAYSLERTIWLFQRFEVAAEPAIAREWLHPDVLARRGLFEPAEVARVLAEHRRGVRDHSHRIWSLIVLEQWMRLYVD